MDMILGEKGIMDGHSFELITGPMSCGKTEELLRRIRRCIIAKKKVIVISPDIDTRAKGDYIESRNGLWLDAVKVKHSIQILSLVKDAQVVAIDELQFFDSNIVPVIIAKKDIESKNINIFLFIISLSNIFNFITSKLYLVLKK